MRSAVIAFILLVVAGCAAPPRPFEHDGSLPAADGPGQDTIELAIAPPAGMPTELGQRVAAALAIELQSYGVLAVVDPQQAPMRLTGATSTRDAELAIEIEIAWYVERDGRTQGPAVSKTRAQPQDYAEATDRLVSRIAQQAAPRVATLIGRPPTFQPRSPGQVAAGVSVPRDPEPEPASNPLATAAAVAPGGTPSRVGTATTAGPAPVQVKVMVAPVSGAPSDGNRQLFSSMRRALGSSRIVVIDKPGADTFTVIGAVTLTQIDDRNGQLVVKWLLKDSAGKTVGDLEQSNPVPLAATRGTWAGFGDVVATAAAEGILELLNKALNSPP